MLKIDFEAIDAAGKTTGLKYFIEQAKKRGLSIAETREVGNPNVPICVKLREVVLSPDSHLDGKSMEFIFAAMRIENDIWLKKLQDSDNVPDLVVSDRGLFSHLAYTDHNVSEEFTKLLYEDVVKKLTNPPDVVIYFSVDTDVALKRMIGRGQKMDVIELKGTGYQEKVRESFEKYLFNSSMNNKEYIAIFEVDANQDIAGVRSQLDLILDQIADRVQSRRSGAW